jgi:glycosyltransferase involved in cell wall biosynthesis
MDGSKSDKVTYMIERFFHKYADVTTYVNGYDYKIADKWSGHENNVLVYNGVNLEEFSPSEIMKVEDTSEKNESIQIGISARIVHEKGYSEFLDLIRHYLYKPDIKFVILGTGPDADYYKKSVKEIIKDEGIPNDKVVFHGYTENVSGLIKEWDINILPSYREGLSISLIEACAVGIPSVATRIRGNVEIIDEGVTGFLYEPRNSSELIECVESLIQDKALRVKLGQAARKKAEELFDEAKMLDDYSNIVNCI